MTIDLSEAGARAADIHPGTFRAIDEIDASFFSGDAFHSPESLAFVEAYLARWNRQVESIRGMLAETADEEDDG